MTALRDDVIPVITPMPRTRSDESTDERYARRMSIYDEADEFLRLFHRARPRAGQVEARLAKMRAEVAATGTYRQTQAELAFGARMALRESGWCPANVPWRGLLVRDLRAIRDGAAVAAECVRHLSMATGDGRVAPMVSVFAPDTPWRPGPRIRNDQLVRYAGYREPDEIGAAGLGPSVLGDRRYVDFTIGVCRLGWRPPAGRGAFDQLPLVVQTPQDGATVHPLPREVVLEVPLEHPELRWFVTLGLRWHAVPVISNLRLSIGGIDYPAAPFNGVYICRAIGEDVLADEGAYGLARRLGERLGLNTSDERTLWRDRVIVELNRAVLHSFDAAGVRIEHAAEGYVPAYEGTGRPAFRAAD